MGGQTGGPLLGLGGALEWWVGPIRAAGIGRGGLSCANVKTGCQEQPRQELIGEGVGAVNG